jgi:hypothetical protein
MSEVGFSNQTRIQIPERFFAMTDEVIPTCNRFAGRIIA